MLFVFLVLFHRAVEATNVSLFIFHEEWQMSFFGLTLSRRWVAGTQFEDYDRKHHGMQLHPRKRL